MILGIEDKSKRNIAFSVESIIAVTPEGEHCNLYLAHINGKPFRIHLTVAEFMTNVTNALQKMQSQHAILGGVGPMAKQ